MTKFRKKPVVIDAWCWAPPILADMPAFIVAGVNEGKLRPDFTTTPPHMMIDTLEGTMRAEAGDWIIQGVKGELYSCKPDVFAISYEPLT